MYSESSRFRWRSTTSSRRTEGKPSLGRLRVLRCSFDPAGDCSLREIEPEHQELTMNAWCSPGRILSDHSEDQIANFFGNMLTANHSASPRDYTPVHGKSCAMPADNRLRAHDDEGLLPSCPESARENPEEFVEQLYVRSRVTTLQEASCCRSTRFSSKRLERLRKTRRILLKKSLRTRIMAACYPGAAVESNPYVVDFKGGQSFGEAQERYDPLEAGFSRMQV